MKTFLCIGTAETTEKEPADGAQATGGSREEDIGLRCLHLQSRAHGSLHSLACTHQCPIAGVGSLAFLGMSECQRLERCSGGFLSSASDSHSMPSGVRPLLMSPCVPCCPLAAESAADAALFASATEELFSGIQVQDPAECSLPLHGCDPSRGPRREGDTEGTP